MREIIDRTRLPQTELARLSGVSYATFHAWLTGNRNPSRRSLLRVAASLEQHSDTLADLAARLRSEAE
jgi:transcriptional regulator with XRE-family HTH domain